MTLELFTILCDTSNDKTNNITEVEFKLLMDTINEHKNDIESVFQLFCCLRYLLLSNPAMIVELMYKCNSYNVFSDYLMRSDNVDFWPFTFVLCQILDVSIGSCSNFIVKVFGVSTISQDKFFDSLYFLLLRPRTEELSLRILCLLMNYLVKDVKLDSDKQDITLQLQQNALYLYKQYVNTLSQINELCPEKDKVNSVRIKLLKTVEMIVHEKVAPRYVKQQILSSLNISFLYIKLN